MSIDPAKLVPLAAVYLERQPWFRRAAIGEANLELIAYEELVAGIPGLGRLILERAGRRFQVICGWRMPSDAASTLRGRESALFGPIRYGDEQVLCFDALEDDDLAIAILGVATEGAESARRTRRVSSLTSHAALVFDERLFMKCYRVLETGTRPEVEAVFALDEVGFNALVAPVACWRAHGADLALIREFLPSALEGRLLALTSLRDLLAHSGDAVADSPGQMAAAAGGDLASEMRRLGAMTAHLHLALAESFGTYPADPSTIEAVLEAAGQGESAPPLVADALGRAIRLHGDYHLRRVMRTEFGWVVAGFSDDPIYGVARPSSSLPPRVGLPLEDLADMNFSMSLVAHEALDHRSVDEPPVAVDLIAAWERRNRSAFFEGYIGVPAARLLLPTDQTLIDRLLAAFEFERERRYEATSAEG